MRSRKNSIIKVAKRLPPFVSKSSAEISQLISQIVQKRPKSELGEGKSEVLTSRDNVWTSSVQIEPNQWKKYKLSSLLRWGWVFLERTQILSGIQFTTHFIEFFVVETKQIVGSTVNVILTRQTCGLRSMKAAENKRRALGNCFFRVSTQEKSYFAIALRFFKRKSRSCAQT